MDALERLLGEALEKGASDVHLEPGPGGHTARLRVGEALLPALGGEALPSAEVEALADRARLLRHPADRPRVGALELEVGGRLVRFRASALPALGGLVLGLHRPAQARPDLGALGLGAPERAAIERALEGRGRLLLLCGPGGSGKTTALYAALAHAAAKGRLVISAEQPVEARVPGVHQYELDPERGLDADAALPGLLVQGADVVGLDEVRDWKAARAAVRIGLAGRTGAATLSANDATAAVSRLLNMGVEPFLLVASVRTVVAMRLLNRLCPACRVPAGLAGAEREALEGARAFAAPGCAACAGSGRAGRLPLFEALEYTPALQDLILCGASASELRAEALRLGLRSLRRQALELMEAGELGAAEVLSSTPTDPPPAAPPQLAMSPAERERLQASLPPREGEGQP